MADENQKNTSKFQKQEIFELFSHSSTLHPQSCYISRYIHTLHGLNDLLEEIKAGKSSDPNLSLESNESTILRSNSYDFCSKELLKPTVDGKKEVIKLFEVVYYLTQERDEQICPDDVINIFRGAKIAKELILVGVAHGAQAKCKYAKLAIFR
ncbi:1272_t:CDS:2 [Diversispora eburnea]|uniref:1272_t:CDS:1 n=1 Tax=Diversispora eburnea TaxID=1213867 RepID=A0A9N9G7Z9_9GLOM|nr:1272_t:CDS:2 [Diversispora eburnea]